MSETEREFLGRRVEELKASAGEGYDISAIMRQADCVLAKRGVGAAP